MTQAIELDQLVVEWRYDICLVDEVSIAIQIGRVLLADHLLSVGPNCPVFPTDEKFAVYAGHVQFAYVDPDAAAAMFMTLAGSSQVYNALYGGHEPREA